MTDFPAGYYSRFDPAKNYEQHLFRAGFVLQSAELNEIQESQIARLRGISDSLFKDGSIVRDCVVIVDPDTGATTCSSGAIYLLGAIRGVAPASFTVPVTGTVAIGIRLVETVVTEVEDPTLKDPAVGLRNYARAGAARLVYEPVWGWDGDGSTSDFYPVYSVENGTLLSKDAPPQIDAVTQAIAKYDRDSSGGTYVVSGLTCSILPDAGGNQVYSVAAGSARVNGAAVTLATARRIAVAPAPDLRFVSSEPHTSAGTSSQRVNLNLSPVQSVTSVQITARKTVSVTHGSYTGVADVLPDPTVLVIESVTQGATTYVSGTDYQLTGSSVDWAPAGAEPATGSTYSVTYTYIATVSPDSIDSTGLYVSGAVTGSLILVSYNQYLPRLDRICLSDAGTVVFIKGIPASVNPVAPEIPATMLGLATITQTWTASRSIVNNAIRVVQMQELAGINSRLDGLLALVAQQALESDVHSREATALKGLFTDPFIDDSQRDAGLTQTAAVYDGVLGLPITLSVDDCDNRTIAAGQVTQLDFIQQTIVSQPMKTTSMLVNPYSAFAPIPAVAKLKPSIDRWVSVTDTRWVSAQTRLLGRSFFWDYQIRTDSVITTASNQDKPAQFLRTRDVSFEIDNFAPGEALSTVTMDGVAVSIGSYTADGSGTITGTFTIPANIPAGSKAVVFTGAGGSVANAVFVGQGIDRVLTQTIIREVSGLRVDPLAQTFTLLASRQVSAVGLTFTAVGTKPVEVQIRETSNGVPTEVILASARLNASALNVGSETLIGFARNVALTGGVEYALVILTDDATTAVAVAALGQFDSVTNRWVTAQPYQVGVLLSSSNASTWTAHQDRDLTFRILGSNFTSTVKTVALGSVTVTAATDLAVRANVETPTSASYCAFILTLPDSSTIRVVQDQVVQLAAPITGNVQISAELHGTSSESPVLHRDVQLAWGVISGSGTYISRAIPGGTGVKVRVIVEVNLPGSSSLVVAAKGTDDGSWTDLTQTAASATPDGWVELTFESATLTKTLVHSRLSLSGSTQYRPRARNLRMLVV